MAILKVYTKYSFDQLSDKYGNWDTTLTFTQRGGMLAASEGDAVDIYESEKFGGEYWGKGTVIEVDTVIGKVYVDMD